MLSILLSVVLIGRFGGVARPFLIGVQSSRSGLFPIDTNSASGSDVNTAVKMGPNSYDAWLQLAGPYFLSMPVLRALDTDRDFALSPAEIANAPAVLRRLDINHEGSVTAEECGLHFDPGTLSPAMQAQLRRRFMNYHPLLAALDADHNGVLSAGEIDRAAVSLKKLDRNHDGYLTADELIPSEMAARARLR
jgi:hypothetical protein